MRKFLFNSVFIFLTIFVQFPVFIITHAQNQDPLDKAIEAAEKIQAELVDKGRLQAELRDRMMPIDPSDPEWDRFTEIDHEAKNTIDKLRMNRVRRQMLQYLKTLSPEERLRYVEKQRKFYPNDTFLVKEMEEIVGVPKPKWTSWFARFFRNRGTKLGAVGPMTEIVSGVTSVSADVSRAKELLEEQKTLNPADPKFKANQTELRRLGPDIVQEARIELMTPEQRKAAENKQGRRQFMERSLNFN